MHAGSYFENDEREDVRLLTGPRVDALRLALVSNDAINAFSRDLLRDLRRLQLQTIERAQGHAHDLAHVWPRPDEITDAQPVSYANFSDESAPFQFWELGSVKVVPKLSGLVLADFQTDNDGPGWLRVRDVNASKRNPYAVILDVSSSWLWKHKDAPTAARAAVQWWIDCHVLDDLALEHIRSGASHRVTRLDVCADHWWAPVDSYYGRDRWTPEDHRQFCTRAKSRGFDAGPRVEQAEERPASRAYYGPRSFTLYIGKRGGVGPMFRIYDKTAELASRRPKDSKSAWFWHPITDLWTERGWDRKSPVWRCEIELPSRLLHHMDGGFARMSHLDALNPCVLWSHCLRNTRHTIDKDHMRSRDRRTSNVWSMLQQAAKESDEAIRIPYNPSMTAPDLDAVKRAVKSAMSLGAMRHAVLKTCVDAIAKGAAEYQRRKFNAATVARIEQRHAALNQRVIDETDREGI
tara:strand:- start:552 stop:1943 length:1392 start_codon:yes stop_codon:yes gene_type:complete